MEEQIKKRKRRKRRTRQRKASMLSNIILVIALVVFVFSAYKLYSIFSEYNRGEKEYEAILDNVVSIVPQEKIEETEIAEEAEEVFKVDFEKLKAINPDIVGWIRFENPDKISYPIVQGDDNNQYLRRTIEGKKNTAGSIFMEASNKPDFSDRNTFIYGHNMRNGSMFGQLRKYKNYDFYKENPYFYIYTPDGKENKYEIFSVCIVEDTSESYNKYYTDEQDYLKYLEYVKSLSKYDTGVEVSEQTQLVSLSTCTNVTETQRLLIHAVKLEEPVEEGQEEKLTEPMTGEQQ